MVDIDTVLWDTLEDRRLSRSERRALTELLADQRPSELALWRHRAFEQARRVLELGQPSANEVRQVVDWLEEVIRTIAHAERPPESPRMAESFFSPGKRPLHRITGLLEASTSAVDICVFTITDDRIADVIVDTHQRGVAVRVVSDGRKAADLGSDVCDLRSMGIEVRMDHSEAHMHHKFAVFDDRVLLTGSYNWTRAAARENQENVLVTDDWRLTEAYRVEFERLWRSLEGTETDICPT
ncbi:MAG: phospholipase D-like domain-containing protein [Myxococcota bacterium]